MTNYDFLSHLDEWGFEAGDTPIPETLGASGTAQGTAQDGF
jgi:hypothetical protein